MFVGWNFFLLYGIYGHYRNSSLVHHLVFGCFWCHFRQIRVTVKAGQSKNNTKIYQPSIWKQRQIAFIVSLLLCFLYISDFYLFKGYGRGLNMRIVCLHIKSVCLEMLPTIYSDNKATVCCVSRPILGFIRDHIHSRPPHRPVPDRRRHRHVLHANVVPNSGLGPRDRVRGTDGHRGRTV